MAEQFDFANAANWDLIFSDSRNALSFTPGSFIPIPEFNVTGAFPLNTPIIASYATCSTAKPTWNTAGWLYQNVQSGLSIGGLADASIQGSKRVPLSRIQIHFWEKRMKNYQLTFKVPKWIYQISLKLWQYTGPIAEPDLDAIELTRIDVLRTEAKVDALFKELGQ